MNGPKAHVGPVSAPGALSAEQALRVLAAPARRAERRIRCGRSLEWATTAACLALFGAAAVLVLRKTGYVREGTARVAIGVALLVPLAAAAVAYLRPVAARAGAVALDRYHGLADRISSALAFLEMAPPDRSPFMELAILDAVRCAGSVDPKAAAPLRRPKDFAAMVGLLVTTIGLGLFEVRQHLPVVSAKTIDAVDVTADDLDAMRDFLRTEAQRAESEETRSALQAYNQLIEDLAEHRLDRAEAFRRMQALEDRLLEGREADKKALEDALQQIGERLKRADLTRPAGEALDAKNLMNAAEALKKLAEKLRNKGSAVDKKELEKMREALERASGDAAARQEAIARRREELERDLLREKQGDAAKDGGANEEEKSLLQKKERELERLSRKEEEQRAAGRQLERLDRELAQAAEDLMKDMGQSAKDLDQGAEDINRVAREQMTQEEKEELKQKIDELREMLRQQGQGGPAQMVRLRRFQSRARGERGQGGRAQQGQGQEGQEGQEGQGEEAQSGGGREGQGQEGQNGQPRGQSGRDGAEGQKGQGQSGGSGPGQGGEAWVLGPNGEPILMISRSRGEGEAGGGTGEGKTAHEWGKGHDPNVQRGATISTGGTEDTQVEGRDTGQGSSRSEVIHGAAERGFASARYTKVYREYHAVAEEALGKDEIPGGYRFYVKRYFQLIRPRE
jgi:hypothetical protein